MKKIPAVKASGLTFISFIYFLVLPLQNHAQGVLYGMTQYGGSYNKGVPYQINTDGSGFLSFRDFNGTDFGLPGDGARFSQINERRSIVGLYTYIGHFVGLTESGYLSTGYGNRVQVVVGKSGLFSTSQFRVTTSTGTNPTGGLLPTSSGRLYGFMSKNGQFGDGTLFSTLDALVLNSTTTVLASFQGPSTGRMPRGTPILARDGSLYGMTEFGGAFDAGVIFSFNIVGANAALTKKLDFDGQKKGSNPTGSLVQADDGRLYGMTRNGGLYGHGVIFSVRPDGTDFVKLVDFNGLATGSHPMGSLVTFTDGTLYGMTSSGGTYGFGTIFRISRAGAFQKILDFNGANGKAPRGDLLIDSEGANMYGTTYSGGANDQGVLFVLQGGNQFIKLYDYNSSGSNPVGALAMTRKQFRMSIEPITDQVAGTSPFEPVVRSEVDRPYYFVSTDTSIVAIRNNKLIFKTSGSCSVMAIQPGNHEYLDNQASVFFNVLKTPQSIKFDPLPAKVYGDGPFALSASASSGLPVTFVSNSPSVSINGNTVTIRGAGHFTITASQTGDGKFESAKPVEQHLFVDRATQTLSVNAVGLKLCCDYFNLSASSSAGLAVAFRSDDLTKLNILGTSAEPLDIGNVTVTAWQPGNTNYKPAEKSFSVEILKGLQTISFFNVAGPHRVGGAPVYLSAGSSANLPVTFTSNPPGIAVVQNGYLFLLSAGTTQITATQPGNSKFSAATPVTRTITVNPALTPGIGNTISFPELLPKTATDAPFNLVATSTSGLPVSYTSSDPSIAQVDGNLVTIKGTGSVDITAFQPGNDTLAAATAVVRKLQIDRKGQLISLNVPTEVTFGVQPIPLRAVSSAGLPITYSLSDNSIGSVDNYYLTIKGSGTLTITATQAGNDQYMEAATVLHTLIVRPALDQIYIKPLPEFVYGDDPFEIESWNDSGMPLTFSSSNSSIASVSGARVTILSAGTVTLAATNTSPGYQNSTAQRTLIIRKAKQTITFAAVESKKFGAPAFQLSASTTAGLPITFVTSTPGVVRVDGRRVTIIGHGIAEISAIQPGSTNFEPAQQVSHTFEVADLGNVYEMVGTSALGGPNGSGVIFSMNSSGSSFDIIKQFGVRTMPKPMAGFIRGNDGKFYGTLRYGGAANSGSVVRIEADGSGFTYLYHLQGTDGKNPFGNLTQANDGFLYGTTSVEGANGGGTLFRIKADGTQFKVIYNFSDLSGRFANNVIQADDGKLYGVTQAGGFYSHGSIFSINTDGSGFTILKYFNDSAAPKSGQLPRGGLVQGPDGLLYGINSRGGDFGDGVLFRISKDGSGFLRVVQFKQDITGSVPGYEVIFGSDGRIYGMTAGGGTYQQGTVFSVNPDGTNFVQLHSFEDTDTEQSPLGSNPFGKLVDGTDGYLYGTTAKGGTNSQGTIFRIGKDGNGFSIMVNLEERAGNPGNGPLVEAAPGVFLGMTTDGGSQNGGTVFKVTSAGVFDVVYDFPQGTKSPRGLVTDASGEYYFGIAEITAVDGGAVFRVRAADGAYQEIYDFPAGQTVTELFYASTGHLWVSGIRDGVNYMLRMNVDGTDREEITAYNDAYDQKQFPVLSMVENASGNIYGITGADSWSSPGFFKIRNDGKDFEKLLDLAGRPTADLLLASDGNYYVSYDQASIFRITPTGQITKIFTHPYPGDSPKITKLIELNGGRLAAVTSLSGFSGSMGAPNRGSIFTLDNDGSNYKEIYGFVSRELVEAIDILQTMDGWICVVFKYGGANSKGMIARVSPDGSSFIKVRDFTGEDGENPTGVLFRRSVQSFTFNALSEKKTTDPAFIPQINSTSGAPVTLVSSNPNVARIEDGQIIPVSPGTTTITATLAASANFLDGGKAERVLVVVKGDQSIAFNALPKAKLRDKIVQLNAIATSGLSVNYESSDPAVASISGSIVTLLSTGSTTITASQAGDSKFLPALPVSQVLTVHEGTQTITFAGIADKVMGMPSFDLSAISTSGLSVVYSTGSDKISIDGSQITLLKPGKATVVASQPGNGEFDPAAPVKISFCINPVTPVITESGEPPEWKLLSSNDSDNQWYLDGAPIAEAANSWFNPTLPGSYTVVTSVEGCASQASAPVVFLPTSIEDLPHEPDIYPNPAADLLYVSVPGGYSGLAKVRLMDGVGRTLQSNEAQSGAIVVFDLRHVNTSVLFIMISVEGRNIAKKVLRK